MADEIVPITSGPTRPADARTLHIIGMMTRKEWERGYSTAVLAKEWGMATGAVERYATEAAKFLRICNEPETLRTEIILRLREIGGEDKGDRVPAMLGLAKMVGVAEPRAPDVGTQTSRAERIAHLCECLREPDDELLEAMRMARLAILERLQVG